MGTCSHSIHPPPTLSSPPRHLPREQLALSRQTPEPATAMDKKPTRLSLLDLLTLAGIIAVLVTLLLPHLH